MGNITKRDEKMLKLCCEMEIPIVAARLGISENAVHQRFAWLRRKRVEWRRNLNIVLNAEKVCGRVRKMLTPNKLKKKK